jgi:glyoxylase-like metal-dependent hydrolase (beta-lactamase superfamily II)
MSASCVRGAVFALLAFCAGSVLHAQNALPPLKLCALVAASAPAIPAKGYLVQEIRDRLYWLSDGAYNTMFLVSSGGVIAIDPLPTLGANYLKAIAEVTDKPVTHIVYSHEHTDHIGAASLFPENATIVAQSETAKLLATRHDPRRPLPTVTFDDSYTLTVGDQTLILDFKGVNHEAGNIFIYAPKQKVLMLVDVVYPGYMPYPNLGIAVDVPGYLKAHRDALSYDFDTLVAGHVDGLGTRQDVETSLDFATELQNEATKLLSETPFPVYLKRHPAGNKWFAHDAYERELVERCYADLLPKWQPRLAGAELSLRSQCWSMIVAIVVQTPPS